MGEDVGDHEHGIAGPVTHGHFGLRAVLAHDDAVKGERVHEPLELLDAAVHAGVEVDDSAPGVERAGLEVEARGVDVSAHHAEPLGARRGADHACHERLAVVAAVHLVAGLEGLDGRDVLESRRIQATHGLGVGAALRLRDGEEVHVFLRVSFDLLVDLRRVR